MDRSRTFDRLQELPEALAAPLRAALERTASFETTPRAGRDWNEERELYCLALEAAGLPRHVPMPPGASRSTPNAQRAIPRTRDLTPEQRVVAEILAYVEGPDLGIAPMPGAAWARRQWLGLDAPSPLFAIEIGGEPAYQVLRDALARSADEVVSIVRALEPTDRIALLVDVQLANVDFFSAHLRHVLATEGHLVGGDAGAWARAQADRVLALFAPGVPSQERGNARAISIEIARPIFLALVRAGVPIEPRWDVLLPLTAHTPEPELRELVGAIPPERREAALGGALERLLFPSERVPTAMALLARYPYPAIARFAIDNLAHAAKPKTALRELAALGRGHPAIAELVSAKQRELEASPDLTRGPVRSAIPLAELDAIDRAQLEAANARYGGKRASIETLYAVDHAEEQILPRTVHHFPLLRGGAPAYDAWLYMVDSGTVFVARTTEVVAAVIQGSLECPDPGLRSERR